MATKKRSVRRTSNAPTMQDVARLANVSVATVSAAVNGTATVSRERTQRIEDAIAQVGYQRNAVARSLKIGRTHTVGLTVPDLRNPFFTDVVSTIQRTLNDAGYAVMLCCSDESTAKQDQQIRLLLNRMVDGLIVAPAGDDDVMTELITRARKPAVLIDRSCAGLEIDAVVTDNSKAVFEAVDYLLRLGHRRIGYLSGSTDTSTGRERLAGYRRALSDAGLDYDSALVQHGHFRQDEGYRAVIGLLALLDRPSALFSANNLMVIGAMKAIGDMGLACPDDVSVACFDDFPWADVFSPQLTTIAQPVKAIGTHAARMLLDRLEGSGSVPSRQLTLHSRLIIRNSCKPHIDA